MRNYSLVILFLILGLTIGGVDYWWHADRYQAEPTAAVPLLQTPPSTTESPVLSSHITPDLLAAADFSEIKPIKKDHSWFQVDLGNEWSVLKSYIYYQNYPVGVIYEAQGDYATLLSFFQHQKGLTVNVTDTYGDGSFYVNKGKSSQTVNLVVSQKGVIYGFEYLKDNHPRFLQLLNTLSTSN